MLDFIETFFHISFDEENTVYKQWKPTDKPLALVTQTSVVLAGHF